MNVAFEGAFASFVAKRRQPVVCVYGFAERVCDFQALSALVSGGREPMPILDEGSTIGAFIADAIDVVGKMISSGLETAPALVLGLALIVALPFLVFGGAVVRRFTASGVGNHAERADQTTRFRGSLSEQEQGQDGHRAIPAPAFSQAVIEVEADDGGNDEPCDSASTDQVPFQFGDAIIARIGREEDNDIRLKHPTVHRYHALIRRNYEEGYEISDLSDSAGNGVIVNGRRVTNSPLADGDLIALGAARLRFGLPR